MSGTQPRGAASWRADGVVVRTPLLPMDTFDAWATAADPRAFLRELLGRPEISEAIFVASPALHTQLTAWREKPDANGPAERSLAKYIARMAGRATPFGLFSGVSAGTIEGPGRLTAELVPRSEYRRSTRLDNDYLFALVDRLGPELREELTFRPSSSLYRIAGMIRYARAILSGRDRSYVLAGAQLTPHLDATLARAAHGAKLADLAAPLVDGEITLADANEFIDALVESQVIVPELGIHVTGPEPIDGVIAGLPAELPARRALQSARDAIVELDGKGLGREPQAYRAIASSLEGLGTRVDLARLFQVDLVKPATITLGKELTTELTRVITKLGRVTRFASESTSMQTFRTAFQARWEDQEVPLATVLDEETGIGFEAAEGPGSEGSPLLAGLAFPGRAGENRANVRPIDRVMQRRLHEALAAGAPEIELTDKDLDPIQQDRPARFPDAFAGIVRVGRSTVLFQGTSGPSGAQLLGRFCHASPEIHAITRAHHAAEEALRPDVLFAEITHLNEGRIGNVICRPVLRAHEIVYLGVSGAPREHQIELSDLRVSVQGDRVVLRSARLGKEIVPRLTTAHNFRLRSLGVYRFLGALAGQGVENTGFSWGGLGEAAYLPRVRYGKVVLARATWNLGPSELEPITRAVKAEEKTGTGDIAGVVSALQTRLRLPRYVVLADNDNELPIDLENPLLVRVLADELAGRGGARLVELYPAPDDLVVTGPEGAFTNELLVTFIKQPAPASEAVPGRAPAPQSKRNFGPGSEWLYAKIYCGFTTADRVLREAIAPLVRDVIGAGHADRWFFIRYTDPDPHLRVRFHGDPAVLLSKVMPALAAAVEPLIAVGAVRKVVLDTYEREIERYGGDQAIDLIEQVFWRDSDAVMGIVELLDGDAGGDARWRLCVRGMASMLAGLGLDLTAREQVVADGKEMLGREMGAHTALWKRIGDRFVQERAALDHLFERDAARDDAHDFSPGFALLAARDEVLAPVYAALGDHAPATFAWSLLHMHANRLLHASQRAQELVLNDFLRRLYASKRARAKAGT